MNMPGFSAQRSLVGPPGGFPVGKATTASAKANVLCVPWYCCDEQRGCGWHCFICVADLGQASRWVKISGSGY